MNLWHEVSIGDNKPNVINAIIEIPKGSSNKYEIDKTTGLIALDRANYTSSPYPFDYGFVPQTLWEDGDPLDVAVLTTFPLHPGILVRIRPIGVIEMIDDGESDFKVICVPEQDKRWDDVQDIEDINQHKIREMTHFFKTYKQLKHDEDHDGAVVEIKKVSGKQEAISAIEKSIKLYNEKYGK